MNTFIFLLACTVWDRGLANLGVGNNTIATRWSAWSDWSICNHSCGSFSFRFRSRACLVEPLTNRETIRQACPGKRLERERCTSLLCLLRPDQILAATPSQPMANLTRDTTTSQPANIGTTLAGNLSNNTSSLFQRISTEESSPCPYFCDSSATSCGQPNSFSPRKIVGGESSQPHAWPWQVSLWKVNRLLCSATIICKGWVITSAHCFLDRSTFQMRYNGLHLRIGSHTRNINEDGISIRYLNSSQIYLHPMYNIWLKRYDIALVRLDPPLQYSRKVAPLCLPNITKLSVQPGELCYVTGWGSTNGIGPPNTSLKQLLVRVLNNDVCKYKYFYSATYMILCVGGEHKRDTCAGDSGGALMCQSSTNGRWELQGLVSFGASTCGQSGFPTIYMQVPFFLPWIQSVMREQCTLSRNS